MIAVPIHQHGGPEVLQVAEVPTPVAGPGEIRVRVQAVALNHLDVWIRRGLPRFKLPLPHLLGADVAGVVDSLGPGATGAAVGDSVVLAPATSCGRCQRCATGRDDLCREYHILGENRWGGYGEFIVVPDRNVFPRPANLSVTEAASVGLTFLTAWNMLVRRAELRDGETVLIHGAASGVGVAAVQIAKWLGARVIATAGTDAKCKRVRELGADHVINYRSQDFLTVVKELTGKAGADVVFEHVGQEVWEKSIQALAWGGRLVTCGATSGATGTIDLRHLYFRRLSLLGSTMGRRGDLFDIYRHFAEGTFKPVVHQVLPLSDAAGAHKMLEERAAVGKIVLTP